MDGEYVWGGSSAIVLILLTMTTPDLRYGSSLAYFIVQTAIHILFATPAAYLQVSYIHHLEKISASSEGESKETRGPSHKTNERPFDYLQNVYGL